MTETLQRLILDAEASVELLYYRFDGHGRRISQPEWSGESLILPPGIWISFDSYFNALFESQVLNLVPDLRPGLKLKVSGSGVVTIHRQSTDHDKYLAGRVFFDTDDVEELEIEIEQPFGFDRGRLWFEVATDDGAKIYSAEWIDSPEMLAPVSLGIGICTFNRAEYVLTTVQTLAESQAAELIDYVTVVNQGDDIPGIEKLAAAVADSGVFELQVIEQGNFGGCGGFTRAMLELRAAGASHIVLMDDDIRVQPQSLERTARLFQRRPEGIAIGGHMLNLHRPNFIYEAGAKLNPFTGSPEPLHHMVFAGDVAGREKFLKPEPVDYNAWWYLGFDARVLDQIVPMPCFIRGDDIEFGLRLGEIGVDTWPLPGIAVWHEPFYLKDQSWQLYFDVRNRLTYLSLHKRGNWQRTLKELSSWHRNALKAARYHDAALMRMAIEDFTQMGSSPEDTSSIGLQKALRVIKRLGPLEAESLRELAEVSGFKLSELSTMKQFGWKGYSERKVRRLNEFILVTRAGNYRLFVRSKELANEAAEAFKHLIKDLERRDDLDPDHYRAIWAELYGQELLGASV